MFSYLSHVMTLANSIIGVGILAMPFCFLKCGIILSIVLLVVSNWITRICCHYLIKCSLLTRRKSFEFLGLHAFGPSGKLLAELCIIGYLLGTCITYFVVVGDLGPQIVEKMFNLDSIHRHLRTIVMIAVTFCILPLAMLRNVNSLSTLCTASIGFYICLVLKIVVESGTHIVANDWTNHVLYWEPAGVLQCLPIFSMALSCQMQIFEVFGSINNQSLDKLNNIVRNATWICTFVYIAVGFFGYVAFCKKSFAGNILVNLTPSFGSDIIKIGFVLSVAFSFPLVIFPCRASIYSLLYRKSHTESSSFIPEPRFKAITLFIVGFSLCIALMIPSVELIIGLVGSTIGVAICIMFPASSFRRIIRKDSTERLLAQLILISGFCLMILGTYANLNAIDEKSSGAHFEKAIIPLQVPTPLPIIDKVAKVEAELLKNLNQVNEPDEAGIKIDNILKEILPNNKVVTKFIDEHEKQPLPPLPVDESHKNLNLKPLKFESSEPKKLDEIGMQIDNFEFEKITPSVKTNNSSADKKSKNDEAQPMPPLPVEEIHEVEKSLAESIVDEVDSIKVPNVESVAINNDAMKKLNKASFKGDLLASSTIDKNTTNRIHILQSIDKAAIKNEEDIVAEEQTDIKDKDFELRKTQHELKKTKELLERTVDELKEELAKQNKETQHLVVEKLSEVVEKVEQIERKVKKEVPSNKETLSLQLPPSTLLPHIAPINTEDEQEHKESVFKRLTENAHQHKEQEAHASVFEPVSYKTEEQLNNSRSPLLNARLPLPLALLRQSEQVYVNENQKSNDQPALKLENTNETFNKDNIEAIRRDILQLKQDENNRTPLHKKQRVKRETDSKFTGKIYLPASEILKLRAGPAELSFQIENIGRKLKSFKEKSNN